MPGSNSKFRGPPKGDAWHDPNLEINLRGWINKDQEERIEFLRHELARQELTSHAKQTQMQ